jgi:hypothetical protein
MEADRVSVLEGNTDLGRRENVIRGSSIGVRDHGMATKATRRNLGRSLTLPHGGRGEQPGKGRTPPKG